MAFRFVQCIGFMSGEKYVNEIFLLFSGSESAEVSLNWLFKSCELSVKMIPAEDFFKFNSPPTWISRVFDPPERFPYNPIHLLCMQSH